MAGYSDRINHALAFAAKYHDRQARKGTGLPYLTRPANVAIILTRYGCSETAVVAGILHDVVQDSLREGWTRDMLVERMGEKFGVEVLDILLSIVQRRLDDVNAELDVDERREDRRRRIVTATDEARWVAAADVLHEGSSLLTDLRRTVDTGVVWSRFTSPRARVVGWYRALATGLRGSGFSAPIVAELELVAAALEQQLETPPPGV